MQPRNLRKRAPLSGIISHLIAPTLATAGGGDNNSSETAQALTKRQQAPHHWAMNVASPTFD